MERYTVDYAGNEMSSQHQYFHYFAMQNVAAADYELRPYYYITLGIQRNILYILDNDLVIHQKPIPFYNYVRDWFYSHLMKNQDFKQIFAELKQDSKLAYMFATVYAEEILSTFFKEHPLVNYRQISFNLYRFEKEGHLLTSQQLEEYRRLLYELRNNSSQEIISWSCRKAKKIKNALVGLQNRIIYEQPWSYEDKCLYQIIRHRDELLELFDQYQQKSTDHLIQIINPDDTMEAMHVICIKESEFFQKNPLHIYGLILSTIHNHHPSTVDFILLQYGSKLKEEIYLEGGKLTSKGLLTILTTSFEYSTVISTQQLLNTAITFMKLKDLSSGKISIFTDDYNEKEEFEPQWQQSFLQYKKDFKYQIQVVLCNNEKLNVENCWYADYIYDLNDSKLCQLFRV